MEMLKDHPAVAEMLHLLEENGRQEQAAEFSRLIAAVDSVGQQYNGLLAEVQDLKRQLDDAAMKRHPLKDALSRTVRALEARVNGVHTRLQVIRNRIISTAEQAVKNFKQMGISALDTAVCSLRVDKLLETVQQKIFMSVDNMEAAIQKVEAMGQELRIAGGYVKNAGRIASGKGTQRVDSGEEGRVQTVILAPMRMACSTLERMGQTIYSALGAVERLERAAERTRGKREKTSIRKRLEEKEDRPAPAPARKPREEAR